MKQNLNILLLVLLVAVLALSLSAFRQADLSIQAPGDRLVLGDNYILEQGETLDGNLIVLGGMPPWRLDRGWRRMWSSWAVT
ncbi:MAG: hypothetical protein A2W35_17610 [Chloroflexi bacterium RBG_16_57_11]|nr:MAG: hypothetical protein A2W35_17610 [Chloroflexi bacterium RBG_16_57_11]